MSRPVRITFHGAALTTTGSMHLVEANGARVLLDCGLFQGKRKEAFERNRQLPFEAASIDRVILSHAHIDHSGNLPTLVRQGFRGEVLATPATRDLCDVMLRDSAHVQLRDVEHVNKRRLNQGKRPFEPLYTSEDIARCMPLFRAAPYETEFEAAPGVTGAFHDAGHILGSAMVSLDFSGVNGGKRLLFTGDLGRPDMPLLRDPAVVSGVDWLITESTYGNRDHPPKADVQGRLKGFIEDIQAQRSRLVIPAFSVGRTQILVFYLREIYERGRIGRVPVYVDSPLSFQATEVHERHPECYDTEAMQAFLKGEGPFQFRGLTYVTQVEESKKLNDRAGPMIIISASGMCEAGRILHHLAHTVEDPTNIVLIVGYQAQDTLGRRLVEHASPVKIFGEPHPVRARVHTINALSSHADRNEMMAYFDRMGPKVERAFCVHGEADATAALAGLLRDAGAENVVVPQPGENFDL